MIGLTSKIQDSIVVNGNELKINNDFRSALTTWEAFEQAYNKKILYETLVIVAYKLMLDIDIDENNIDYLEADIVIKELSKYFNKYASISDSQKSDGKPPLICFIQDEVMIRDAFRLLGKDLYRDNMDYPEFMANLRLITTTDAMLNRVMYLRMLIQDKKISKKEYKTEREEIKKIGEDIVLLKPKISKREQEEKEKKKAERRKLFKNVGTKTN